jgi:hypothetical protein
MKRPSPVKQDEVLRDILVPVLAEATIGRFDQDVPMDGQPPDVSFGCSMSSWNCSRPASERAKF